jgi:hypothetical protein
MTTIYTYSEARQNLASLLDEATKKGSVRVKRRDGRTFIIQPEVKVDSPLDIQGIDLNVSTQEIVEFIQESRRNF